MREIGGSARFRQRYPVIVLVGLFVDIHSGQTAAIAKQREGLFVFRLKVVSLPAAGMALHGQCLRSAAAIPVNVVISGPFVGAAYLYVIGAGIERGKVKLLARAR